MDVYFGEILAFSQNPVVEPRVRCGLQEQERRKADGPKKIAEVHAEAKEELRQQAMAQNRRSRHGPSPSHHISRRRSISDYGRLPGGQTGTPMDKASSRPLECVDGPLRTTHVHSANTAGFGLRLGGPLRLDPTGASGRLGPKAYLVE